MRRLAVVVVLSLACASCGSVTLPSAHSLRAQVEQDVAQAVLGRAGYRQARGDVARLIRLCRQATGSADAHSVRRALANDASRLRRSQPRLAADLDRALRGGCR